MEHYIKILKATSDPVRIKILKILLTSKTELCVCEIVDALELPFYTVSRHLKELKNAAIIQESKDGKFMLYSVTKLEDDFLKKIVELINTIPEEKFSKELKLLQNRLGLRVDGRCVVGLKKDGLKGSL